MAERDAPRAPARHVDDRDDDVRPRRDASPSGSSTCAGSASSRTRRAASAPSSRGRSRTTATASARSSRPRRMPTSFDYLLTQAVSRIYLDNVDHIQSSWVTQGMKIGQVALEFGADDLGSMMIEENVVSAAGTTYRATDRRLRPHDPGARQDAGAARHAVPRRPRLRTRPALRGLVLPLASARPCSRWVALAAVVSRRLARRGLAAAVAGGRSRPTELMPGVTYERQVAVHAARPGRRRRDHRAAPGRRSTRSRPVLSDGTVSGGRETRHRRSSGRLARRRPSRHQRRPRRPPRACRAGSSLQGGVLAARRRVDALERSGSTRPGRCASKRVGFVATWQGSGQRRPLHGVNQPPRAGQSSLFTPAWGPTTPSSPGATEVVLDPFPAAAPDADLTAPVTAQVRSGGGTPIPPDGAVLDRPRHAAARRPRRRRSGRT